MKTKKIINLCLLVMWCIVIFMFSHQNSQESTDTSVNFTETIITVVDKITHQQTPQEKVEQIIKDTLGLVRKCGHFIEFLILGILTINVLKDYIKLDKLMLIYSVLFCFCYACSDEFHQLFVAGRGCQFKDVLIDASGAIIGICLYYLNMRKSLLKRVKA